jgi:tryptophan-rich sensory protein
MDVQGRGRIVTLLPFLVAVALAAGIGSFSQPDAWYLALRKPPGTPPNVVFPIVWTTLYVLMAVAAWRVWRIGGFDRALGLWALQLGLNAAWSPVFFLAHEVWIALAIIVALWFAIAATTHAFFRRDRAAGWMMVPYLAWVTYAAYLNAGIAMLR